jgi:DNA-binding PadR family transcriptional regulator
VPELSPTSYLVLGLIDGAGQATPYELKQMAGSISGLWALRHDQVYREPASLAELGLLDEEREEDGRRRRRFRINEAGKQELQAWLASPTAQFTELHDVGLLQLFLGADPRTLAEVQLDAHEERLREYEEWTEKVGREAPEGARLALESGVGHEREWVRFWRKVAEREQ